MTESVAQQARDILSEISSLEHEIHREEKYKAEHQGHCGLTSWAHETLSEITSKAHSYKVNLMKKALVGKRKQLQNLK